MAATNQADGTPGARQWWSDGWAVIADVVSTAEVDAALEEVFRLVPTAQEYHRDPEAARTRWGRGPSRPDPGILAEGPDFRPEQYRWECLFPFSGSPRLNQLCIHPGVVALARECLDSRDVRLYQAGLDVKYSGDADYEQPLHVDSNHSLLPASGSRRSRNLEGFLYLTDVRASAGATRLVRAAKIDALMGGEPPVPWPSAELAAVRQFFVPGQVFPSDRYPELYTREVAAEGSRGSFLAYGPDVVHRGAGLTENGVVRILLNLSFKAAEQEWVGFHAWQPSSNNRAWKEFVADRTPDELSLFGYPPPGHPIWDRELIGRTSRRYPGLDMRPWADALDS